MFSKLTFLGKSKQNYIKTRSRSKKYTNHILCHKKTKLIERNVETMLKNVLKTIKSYICHVNNDLAIFFKKSKQNHWIKPMQAYLLGIYGKVKTNISSGFFKSSWKLKFFDLEVKLKNRHNRKDARGMRSKHFSFVTIGFCIRAARGDRRA